MKNNGRSITLTSKQRLATHAYFAAWWLVGAALSWSLLGTVVDLHGWGFGYGPLGVGGLATAAAAAAVVGVLRPARWPWRLVGMLVPLVLAGVLLMVFPPRWLLWLFNARDAPLYVVSSQRVVALTIDDGVDPVATPPILEVLAKHQVRATFFVLASTIEAHPQLARDIVAAGHELGNHQTRDEPGFLMPDNAFAADIRRAGNLLAPYGPVRWLRPGGGITSSAMKQAAGEQGYRVVLGSVFPLDSHIASATFAVNFIEARVFAGSIVVLHDGPGRGERTARVLDRVLPRLKSAGFRVVPYGEL